MKQESTRVLAKDLYQVQESLKKLCKFSTVWADRAKLGSTENFCNFAKIFYFQVFFKKKFMSNTSTKSEFLHIEVSNKKMSNIKVKKSSILALKSVLFLVKIDLSPHKQLPHFLYLVQIFGTSQSELCRVGPSYKFSLGPSTNFAFSIF